VSCAALAELLLHFEELLLPQFEGEGIPSRIVASPHPSAVQCP
jgi:hypothetical protein